MRIRCIRIGLGRPDLSPRGANPGRGSNDGWHEIFLGPAPGLRLTVDGPAFGGPVRFVVPDSAERLNASIDDPSFTARLQRTNNKHKHEFYETQGDFRLGR